MASELDRTDESRGKPEKLVVDFNLRDHEYRDINKDENLNASIAAGLTATTSIGKKFQLLSIMMHFDTATARDIDVYITDGTNDWLLYEKLADTSGDIVLEFGNEAYVYEATKEIKVVIGTAAATTIDLGINYEVLEQYANA